MSEFTQGEWEVWSDYKIVAKLQTPEGNERREVIAIATGIKVTPERTKANARLIAAAPELYKLLKEELIPTSDYGGILSFERERKVTRLLDRIDGKEE